MKGVVRLIGLGVALALAGCQNRGAQGDFALSADSAIVLSDGATESSKLAARELADYFFKAVGVRPAIRSGNVVGSAVVIGTLATLGDVPADVREKLSGMRQFEASWTGVRDGKLWIVGKNETAELYAVYHFLEKHLGVRWFQAPTAEDPGEDVPKAASFALAAFSEFREPDFKIRKLDGCGRLRNRFATNGMTCATRNGFQTQPFWGVPIPRGKPDSKEYKFFAPRIPLAAESIGGGHTTFAAAMPASKCFDAHPEWFAQVDGVRRHAKDDLMTQYCLSNPEVRRNVANAIIAKLEKTGGLGAYCFGQVDTPQGMCQCEKCKALDGPHENGAGGTGSRTTRFVKTINEIAAQVWTRYPDADLRMWAYLNYRELPEGVKPDPRFTLYFCSHERCFAHRLDDPSCARNVRVFGLLKEWLKLLPNTYLYDYLTCTRGTGYTCNEFVEASDIALYKRLGMVGWKEEGRFSDSQPYGEGAALWVQRFPSVWQWLYVSGHLLWDASLDVRALVDDVESRYYGKTYPAMKKYQALRRELWSGAKGCVGYSHADERTPRILDRPGAKDRLLALLDEAERLAAGDKVLLFRVGRDRKWLREFWIAANDEAKKSRSLVYHVPRTATPPTIDGDLSDGVWTTSAAFADQFCRLGSKKPPAPELATTVGMTYDDDNLYFVFEAKTPDADAISCNDARPWGGDSVEVFLHAPTADNHTCHLAVNAKGTVWGDIPGAYGATAAVKVGKDRFVVELKVPAAKIGRIADGDVWRVQFCRNYPNVKGSGTHWYSLDGASYGDGTKFRSLSFGRESYLRNGSFDELKPDGLPKGWGFENGTNGVKVLRDAGGVSVRLPAWRVMSQTMWHGQLRQQPVARRFRYSVRARGKGQLVVSFRRWRDTPDANAKHGYVREILKPPREGGTFELGPETKAFSGEGEVAAGEWESIFVSCRGTEAVIDGVTVDPL